MIFTIKTSDNTDIIYIYSQKPDSAACLRLKKFICNQARVKSRHIVLKISHNMVIDNFFIEMLLSAQEYCAKNDSEISLCGMSPNVMCIVYLIKLDKFFELYEDEYDAFLRENRLVKRRLKAV